MVSNHSLKGFNLALIRLSYSGLIITLERLSRLELPPTTWKDAVLPLHHKRIWQRVMESNHWLLHQKQFSKLFVSPDTLLSMGRRTSNDLVSQLSQSCESSIPSLFAIFCVSLVTIQTARRKSFTDFLFSLNNYHGFFHNTKLKHFRM